MAQHLHIVTDLDASWQAARSIGITVANRDYHYLSQSEIGSCEADFSTAIRMYELHQPCRTKLSLEQFVMMIVESSVADFGCKKYTPRVKPFAPRAHYG
jgi:hypothetical protein